MCLAHVPRARFRGARRPHAASDECCWRPQPKLQSTGRNDHEGPYQSTGHGRTRAASGTY